MNNKSYYLEFIKAELDITTLRERLSTEVSWKTWEFFSSAVYETTVPPIIEEVSSE